MKFYVVFYSIMFLFFPGNPYEKVMDIEAKAGRIALDEAKNIYLIEDTKISRYSPEGKLDFWYSNKFTAALDNIDISNPEKILLFYRQDQKITLLTQYFKVIPAPLFLKEKGFENITAACSSGDDNIWIFDEKGQSLVKISNQGDFITQNNVLSEKNNSEISAAFMVSHQGQIYLTDPNLGILVFDQIGEYQKTIPVKGIRHFRIEKDHLIYTQNDEAKMYDLNSGNEKTYALPTSSFAVATIDLQGNSLTAYVAGPQKVEVYKMAAVDK
ncbi:MAG: hypothetical protein K9H16_10505 [Bacteroidales bacterium]|nr:hypothetical protein [Bacteroidales bacterium]